MSDPRMVLCTCPDAETARSIADAVVRGRLAACVNIVAGLQSVYLWKGAVECDREVLLLVKTNTAAFPALERKILSLHPYELPEIIAVPITEGLQGYLAWIDESVTPTQPTT